MSKPYGILMTDEVPVPGERLTILSGESFVVGDVDTVNRTCVLLNFAGPEPKVFEYVVNAPEEEARQ